MRLRRTPVRGALAAGLAIAALVACNASTTEDPVPPVTGIRVDTLGLFGVDSCGPESDQIAKTAVTLSVIRPPDDAGLPVVDPVSRSGTFDCFTDPMFNQLVALNEIVNYKLRVFGFSAEQYQQGAANIERELAERDADADAVLSSLATVVATCQASEYPNVSSISVCTIDVDRRAPGQGDAGSNDAGSSDAGSTDAGSPDAAADASLDSGADAAPHDAGDGGS